MNKSVLLKIFLVILSVIGLYTIGNSTNGSAIYTGMYDYTTVAPDSTEQRLATDSMAALRTYMKSKRYNDSVDAARKLRMDSIRAARQQFNDSVKAERLRVNDSIASERKRIADSTRAAMDVIREARQAELDSLQAIRQAERDSLDAIRQYRASDTYKDSVAAVRKAILDAKKAEQKRFTDSIVAVRKAEQEQLRVAQQQFRDSIKTINDSIRAVRQQELDSIRTVRKQYSDSMKLVREKRELEAEQRDKDKEKKKKLALELKIQKKRSKYSNEDMRRKSWNIARQFIQNTTTRYNYFFNAHKKMTEAEKNMYTSRADNLDSTIKLLVYDPNVDSAKMTREMDSLIKRIAVGIQIHDPRAKWQDDLYMLLGKSFYYKGDYNNAAASFQYIIAEAERAEKEKIKDSKEKKKIKEDFLTPEEEKGLKSIVYHTPSKNDAIIWLARIYLKKEEYTKSRLLLDMAAKSGNLPERLKGELDLNFALYYLTVNQPQNALPHLDSVASNRDVVKYQRARAGYLAAQIYEANQDWQQADRLYTKVIDMKPDFDIELKSRINQIAARIQSQSVNPQDNIATIRGLINETKYKDYKDQLYYGLGNAYRGINELDKAEESYRSSIAASTQSPKIKGKVYYELGELYYAQGKYLPAKNAYDSALVFLTSSDEPLFSLTNTKSQGLVAVSTPGSAIKAIDSVLALAKMSPREQRSAIKKHLDKIEAAAATSIAAASSPATTASGSSTWYFANTTLVQKGEAEFKQKWGNRKLQDNWRRSSGAFDIDEVSGDPRGTDAISNRPSEDDLLALIPKEQYVIDSLTKARHELEYDLGKAFFKLQDFNSATRSYLTYLANTTPPAKHEEVLNDLYLIALKANNDSLAAHYQQQLKEKFPQSGYLTRIVDRKASSSNTPQDISIAKHFDDTYYILTQEQFRDAIIRAEEAPSLYPSEIAHFQEQYNLIKAIGYAGLKQYGMADTLLTQFIAVSANSKLKEWATTVHELVKVALNQPTIDTTKVTTSSIDSGNKSGMSYTVNKDEKHLVVIKTKIIDGKFMGLKAGITDYNAMKNSSLSLKTVLSSLGSEQELIVIRTFANAAEATFYMNRLRGENRLFKEFPNHTNLSFFIISESNYELLLEKKNSVEYALFHKKNY